MESTLIFDGNCGYCSFIASLASVRGIQTHPYDSPEAKERLSVFDDPGFTLYFFEDTTVYWGSQAAEAVANKLHVPYPVVKIIGSVYPYLVRLINVLTRRKKSISHPTCSCGVTVTQDKSGGIIELDEEQIHR